MCAYRQQKKTHEQEKKIKKKKYLGLAGALGNLVQLLDLELGLLQERKKRGEGKEFR